MYRRKKHPSQKSNQFPLVLGLHEFCEGHLDDPFIVPSNVRAGAVGNECAIAEPSHPRHHSLDIRLQNLPLNGK